MRVGTVPDPGAFGMGPEGDSGVATGTGGLTCSRMLHMTVRISVSLPDSLHEQVKRVADASHVSVAATVRAVLADVMPRMTSILDYLGTAPTITPGDVQAADAWLQDLQRLYDDAPPTFRDAIGPGRFDPPPETGNEDRQ